MEFKIAVCNCNKKDKVRTNYLIYLLLQYAISDQLSVPSNISLSTRSNISAPPVNNMKE